MRQAAGNLHQGPGMRRRRGAVLMLAIVTGCGLVREPSLPGPQAVPAPLAEEDGLPTSDLGHPKTEAWVHRLCDRSAGRPKVALGLAGSAERLPRLRAILEAHGLPGELVAVPAVESRFRADARGRHGERGIWQLRPATARRFGLEVTRTRDDRVHLERATRAAARYLALLYARYGDWPLALAAYNAGEGRVDRALATRPMATFWELAEQRALPPINRDYVPKVLAAARIVTTPAPCS